MTPWAHSNFINNTARGRLAEFIVSTALECTAQTANEWRSYDLDAPSGVKVEVKAAAYVQDWPQPRPSNIVFSIRPTLGWNTTTSQFDPPPARRQADVYVFCLEHEMAPSRFDPLDLSQWTFFVVSTETLNERLGAAKTVSLKTVESLSDSPGLPVGELADAINRLAQR